MNTLYKGVLVNENMELQWYENLQKEFDKRKLQHYEVAELTGMNVDVLFDKISGNGIFTFDEALKIHSKCCNDVPIEILFETSNVGSSVTVFNLV